MRERINTIKLEKRKYKLLIKYLDKIQQDERPAHIARKLSICRETVNGYLYALVSKGLLQASRKENKRAVFYKKTKLWNVADAIKAIVERFRQLDHYAKKKRQKARKMQENLMQFRITREIKGDRPVVEVHKGNVMVATIYPHDDSVAVVSKYFKKVETDKEYPPKITVKFEGI
jgi:hypothetical protein